MSSKSRESPLPYDEVKKNKLQGDFPKEIAKSRTKPAKTQRAKPEKMGSSNSGKALKLFRHASAKLELQESIEKVIENKKAQLIETSPAKRKQHEKSLSAMRKLYSEICAETCTGKALIAITRTIMNVKLGEGANAASKADNTKAQDHSALAKEPRETVRKKIAKIRPSKKAMIKQSAKIYRKSQKGLMSQATEVGADEREC